MENRRTLTLGGWTDPPRPELRRRGGHDRRLGHDHPPLLHGQLSQDDLRRLVLRHQRLLQLRQLGLLVHLADHGHPARLFRHVHGRPDRPGDDLPVGGLRADQQVALARSTSSASSALFLYSVFHLGSLCLLCSGFYLFSIMSFVLFALYGIDREAEEPRPALGPAVDQAPRRLRRHRRGRRLRHDRVPQRPQGRPDGHGRQHRQAILRAAQGRLALASSRPTGR